MNCGRNLKITTTYEIVNVKKIFLIWHPINFKQSISLAAKYCCLFLIRLIFFCRQYDPVSKIIIIRSWFACYDYRIYSKYCAIKWNFLFKFWNNSQWYNTWTRLPKMSIYITNFGLDGLKIRVLVLNCMFVPRLRKSKL